MNTHELSRAFTFVFRDGNGVRHRLQPRYGDSSAMDGRFVHVWRKDDGQSLHVHLDQLEFNGEPATEELLEAMTI